MDADNDVSPEIHESVQQRSLEQSVDHCSSVLSNIAADDELSEVRAELEALPFQDENQKTIFFQNVQRFQGKHVIQIFNLGVVPLHECTKEPLTFLEEVVKLFEICSSFCYAADTPKRVSFEYYIKALKFCFPSQPKRCLSAAVISILLQLVQILQEGKLASIVCKNFEQLINSKMQINGAKHFFGELLETLEKRRDEGDIAEIVFQTLKFASVDASISCIQDNMVETVFLRSDQVVTPLFLTNWIKLLKFTNVRFASTLAKMDAALLLPGITSDVSKINESTVCYFVGILDEMKKSGKEVTIPSDEERLQIFFNHINHFCYHREVNSMLIRLVATTSISNEVLVAVLEQFFCEEKRPSAHLKQSGDIDFKTVAFNLVFKLLLLLPDGKLVNRTLQFWKTILPDDPDYQRLAYLMYLFVQESTTDGRCLLERAEKTLNFLDSFVDRSLLPLINIWHPFLAWFIKEFPASFHNERRQEVFFIQKAAFTAAQEPVEQHPAYLALKKALHFFTFISQQSLSDVTGLLVCCLSEGFLDYKEDAEFSLNAVMQLSVCKTLTFNMKKLVLHELTSMAKCFKKHDKSDFLTFITSVASNQILGQKDKIFFAIFDFVKHFSSNETIPSEVRGVFWYLSRVPISGERIVKILQMSIKSAEDLLSGVRILKLSQMYHNTFKNEGVNEYVDLISSAFVDILKDEKDLRKQFFDQQYQYCCCSSAPVQFVWSFVAARLLSLGVFKEEIDLRCCFPVLSATRGLNSPFEVLQLFSQVRSSSEKVIHVFKDRSDILLSPDVFDCVLRTFASSLSVIVGSNVLPVQEKLLLVKTTCEMFLNSPGMLTEWTLERTLMNLMPDLFQNSNSSHNNVRMRLNFNEIVAMLKHPTIMAQLTRIPAGSSSLSTVLSMMTFDSSSRDKLVDIYRFIGSLGNLDEAFFRNLLTVLDAAIKESNSVEDVIRILREIVCIIRAVPSELIPFIICNFDYLLQNKVTRQEREGFLHEVAMRWNFAPDAFALSYLEVPRLLLKVYTTADTPEKRSGLIERVQTILKKTHEKVHFYSGCGHINIFDLQPRDDIIRKRIACCEMEWLVLHSTFSNEEAALACDMIFRFSDQRMRCFCFSDVQIEDGSFTFVPQKRTSDIPTVSASVGSTGNNSVDTESFTTILTPVSMAQKVILQVKRVLKQEKDLTEIVLSLWDLAFGYRSFTNCGPKCTSSCSLDDYVDVFLSILEEASSTEVMLHWAKIDRHHVCQCSELILKAIKWYCTEENIDTEVVLNFQAAVSTTMEIMLLKSPSPWWHALACFRVLKPQLVNLRNMLEYKLPTVVTLQILNLFQTNFQVADTVTEILSHWPCKQQAMELVESVQLCCQEEKMFHINIFQREFVWSLLKPFGRFCMNSCKDLVARFNELILLHDEENLYGFNHLPKWRETMTADGFSVPAIDCWCVAFLTTWPLQDLSRRNIDIIFYLNSRSLELVASVSQIIKRCIFPEDGFQVVQEEGIKEPSIKERLRLARLLVEFINILKLRKPEENHKDAVIKEIVVDACSELCKAHEKPNHRKSDLYKIREQKLKKLFPVVFEKQGRSYDEEDGTRMTKRTKTVHDESRGVFPPGILNRNEVYEPLLVLLRRWLSGIVVKPTLASLTNLIVQLLFSVHSFKVGPDLLKELHDIIQARVFSLEENQAIIAQLQAVGYNGNLWSSSTVECPGYLSKCESLGIKSYKKKLTEVLRCHWNEWKDIFRSLGIPSIKVGETDVSTQDLFGPQASLEEMEKQVSAVKTTLDQIDSEDVSARVKQLIRLEQEHRARIEKLHTGNKSSEDCANKKEEMKKFVVVWENRFLENVKLCSERIPGCYAPNGFHSEKPVLCALSVDNRIVTVFNEDKSGRREEIENVEVKLMEAGMYVYELHTSGHNYVTDELWAAFFKMVLEERLVLSILLSNKSPGFHWIKEYVKPATSHPRPWKWELHQGIVPQDEDYFDYRPIEGALWPALYGLTQFLTLTRENVVNFQFKDFKNAYAIEEKQKLTKKMTGAAIQELKNELCLLHGDDEAIKKALMGKLSFAVRGTIKSIIDGEHPTEETVKELIDMKKLAYKTPKVQRTEESRKQYAAAVLRACNVMKTMHCE